MRNFLLLAFFWLACLLPGVAQVESDNKFINGTISFLLVANDGDNQSVFTFTPTFGYFLNDRTAVGGTLGIISQPAGSEDNNLTIFLSPFARRYFSIIDDTFYFFVNGSLSLSYGNSAAGFGEFRSSEDAFSVGLAASPGFAFFPAEQWGLDFSLTAFGLTFFDIGGEGGATTLLNIGVTTFSPSLGFSYYF